MIIETSVIGNKHTFEVPLDVGLISEIHKEEEDPDLYTFNYDLMGLNCESLLTAEMVALVTNDDVYVSCGVCVAWSINEKSGLFDPVAVDEGAIEAVVKLTPNEKVKLLLTLLRS